jgi:hypothetical protein
VASEGLRPHEWQLDRLRRRIHASTPAAEITNLLDSGRVPHAGKDAIRKRLQETDAALKEIHRRLEDLDRYFIEQVISWNEKLAGLLAGFVLTMGSPPAVLAQAIKLQVH